MSSTSLTFPWSQPLLPQLVDHLTSRCSGAPWNLRNVLIVVPTQESGRRLREALAVRAKAHGTGLLAPSMYTPEQLVHGGGGHGVASDGDCLAAWCSVLLAADLQLFPDVFPQPAERRDGAWATAVATQISELQRDLRDHGLDCAAVAANVQDSEFEPLRWSQLADLEGQWRAVLDEMGLTPPLAAIHSRLSDTQPPTGLAKVVVAAVPDPAPLAVEMLSRWAQTMEVEIIVHGPPGEVAFDEWGRPLEASFAERHLEFGADGAIHPVRDAKGAGAAVCRLAAAYAGKPRTLAVATVEPGCRAAVGLALAAAGIGAHDPAGTPLPASGIGLLAASLLRLAQDPRPAAAAQVLRHPLIGHYVAAKGWGGDQASLLSALDKVLEQHLPNDLAAATRFAATGSEGLRPAIEWIAGIQRDLKNPGVAASLLRALGIIAAAFPRGAADGMAESAQKVAEVVGEAAEVEERFPGLPPDAAALLVLQAISRSRIFPVPAPGAVDLQGWLELSYEDSPHLVIVGANEGAVPERTRGSAFLPSSLRERLKIRGNRERLIRDRYLFEAFLASRRGSGRVDIVVPRIGADGEPLQPSRLLFCCADDQLVGRARTLFAELPPPAAAPARRSAWRLAPLPFAGLVPSSHSPSSLKAYLACPYRYYLSRILRSECVDTGLEEISALTFGNLCHDALQALGEEARLHDVEDANVLGDFLIEAFENAARKQLGAVDSFALRVQLEAGRARLRAAARVEAESRKEGWRILRCESQWTMTVGGFTFGGRIDRVDRHATTGAYRLLDYKTSDAGEPPAETHWVRAKDGEAHVLDDSLFDLEGRRTRWSDLQLPLYLLATKAEHGGSASAGYFVLPKTSADAAILLWSDLTPEHLAHAERCAIAAADAIARGRFWPPAEKTRGDEPSDYLFPDGIEANVAGDLVIGLATAKGSQ